MENIKNIPLPDIFSKWFINDKSSIKQPYQMAQSVQNIRVNNKITTQRKGFITLINMWGATSIKSLYNYNNKLVFIYNWDIYITNTALTLATNLWVLNTWVNTKDFWPSINSYWDLLMIFNGWIPQLYDWSTLSDITTIDAWYLPNTAEIFSNSQWITNWTWSLIRSKPAISTFPTNLTIFNDVSESVIKTVSSPVVALKSNIQALFIFTENQIYQFNDTYQTGTTPPAPVFNKIYDWQGPWSQNAVCAANNTVFYISKENKIKTINYQPWIPNSQVWDLSNLENNSIQEFIDEELNADQHLSTCQWYDKESLIKFNLRSKLSAYNDLVLIYDLKNNTWLLDSWKNFWTNWVMINWKSYVWSSTTGKIYEDEAWKNDDWLAMTCKRKTKIFDFWDQTIRKILRQLKIWGSINLNTQIKITCETDNVITKTEYIDKFLVSNDTFWIKVDNIKYPFRKAVSRWDLYEKWYAYSFNFEATWTDLDFTLETMNVWVWVVWDWIKNELFEK